MSDKHTPGPWTILIGVGSKGYAGNYEIAEACNGEHEANRRLLEAAPALLAACKAAVEEFSHLGQALGELTQPEMVDAWNKCEAAIALAEGK